MSEGAPRRLPAGSGEPSGLSDELRLKVREVLDRASARSSPIPPQQALAEIAALMGAEGLEATHGLSQAEIDLYIRLWWGGP